MSEKELAENTESVAGNGEAPVQHAQAQPPARRTVRRSAELAEQAAAMRITGMEFRQIAAAQQCSVSTAHGRVRKHLSDLAKKNAADTEALRAMEGARLDRVLAGAMPAAEQGDKAAADTVLKAIAQRCRLYGLEKAPGASGGSVGSAIQIVIHPPADGDQGPATQSIKVIDHEQHDES